MSLKQSAKEAARRDDRLTLADNETAVIIVDLSKSVDHVLVHELGNLKFRCNDRADCPGCQLGAKGSEKWTVAVERELPDGEVVDLSLAFWIKSALDDFASALPDAESGKVRLQATGVAAVDSAGKPVCDKKTGRQYVNLAWKQISK